jgi:TP901 family phage tail tape measure protein
VANETRSVVVKLRAEANGFIVEFDKAGRASDRLAKNVDRSGASVDRLIRRARNLALGAGLAKVATDAVRLEAAYSRTMAQVAVATKAPQSELKELDRLALQLGRDTVFSAQDAAGAMLALAKGGLTPAQIRAGALADTLTLASAGELELGDAANVVVQAMGAFRLRADQTNVAVAALAGGANASSASVSDMTQALSQVGTVANSAGFSIQDTTAYLALFADQGFKGSDAGTSLRTMLGRLVPQTDEARAAMRKLGLTYLDSNGNLVDAEEIAKRTQDAFSGLSDEQRISAAQAIFGQDAIRGVNALTAEGEEGLRKYTTATNDLTQAQKLAKAANSGTAGALENLKGSIETAEIQIGRGLAPVVRELAGEANDLVSGGDIEGWARDAGQGISDFLHEIAPLAKSVGGLAKSALPTLNDALHVTVDALELAAHIVTPLVDAFNKLPDSAQKALIMAGGIQLLNRRLRESERFTSATGGNLLLFGANAKKGGADAKTGASGFSSLATSLKANAAIFAATTGISFGINDLLDQTDTFSRGLKGAALDFEDYVRTFDRNGKVTQQTIDGIKASFADSNIGKYADDLGVDLNRFATDLAKNGEKGKYVQDVLADLSSRYSEFKDALTDLSPFDFGGTESDKIKAFESAFDDLMGKLDGVHEKAARAGEDMNDLAIAMIYGTGEAGALGARLTALPNEVKTAVLTPGMADTVAKVTDLARKYDLTPDEVRTVMEAKDFASKDIKEVLRRLDTVDARKTRAKIRAETAEAKRQIAILNNLLHGIRDRTVYVKVVRTGDIWVNPGGSGGGKQLAQSYMGGRLPQGFAGGGRVPGTPPPNPILDNVLARGVNTGQPLLVRSGEWIINEQQSEKNDPWLRWVNNGGNLNDIFGAFAGGGIADRYTKAAAEPAMALAGAPGNAWSTVPGGPLEVGPGSTRAIAAAVQAAVAQGMHGATFQPMPDGSVRLILKRGR